MVAVAVISIKGVVLVAHISDEQVEIAVVVIVTPGTAFGTGHVVNDIAGSDFGEGTIAVVRIEKVVLAGNIADWMVVAIAVWIPVYLLFSLRHVFQQNWFLTVLKFGVIGISYITLLGILTSIVAVVSFVLL